MKLVRIIVFLLALFQVRSIDAAPVGADCAIINEAEVRLECYDAAFRAVGVAPEPDVLPVMPAGSFWRLRPIRQGNTVGQLVLTTYTADAEGNPLRGVADPSLSFRCLPGERYFLMLRYPGFAGPKSQTIFSGRFKLARSEDWQRTGFGFQGSAGFTLLSDARQLLKAAIRQRADFIDIALDLGGDKRFFGRFSLAHADKAITPMRVVCGW